MGLDVTKIEICFFADSRVFKVFGFKRVSGYVPSELHPSLRVS